MILLITINEVAIFFAAFILIAAAICALPNSTKNDTARNN